MPGQRTALAVLVLVEAAAFAYMSQTVVFPAAVAVAALLGVRGRWLYRLSQDRQVILSLVLALLFVVKWRVQPHSLPDDAMFYLSPFLHSLGQFLLVLQAAALYVREYRDLLPVMLPWPGMFVMVSAGDVNLASAAPQRFAFQIFALAFTATTAAYFAATARAASGSEHRAYGLGKAGVAAGLLVGTAACAWIAAAGLHRYERVLDRLVSELLSPAMSSSSAGFPSRSRLGSIAQRKSERSHEIALRVYARSEPGYLRGKAYHWLHEIVGVGGAAPTTQWEEAPASSAIGPVNPIDDVLDPVGVSGRRLLYDLRDPPGRPFEPQSEMKVWLEASQWGVYFLPPQAARILTSEEQLRRDYRHVTSGTEAGAVTYTVQTDLSRHREIFFDLAAEAGPFSRQALTAVPPGVAGDEQIQSIADGVFEGCRSFDEHVDAVTRHFRTRYGYTIGIQVPPGHDPIRWFLRSRPNAHCEYFAQGAALLLRMRGIPTRYMTGFVVAERNEYGDYWLARNEHAHAWCEAWDDRRGWVIVEATPPAGVPSNAVAPWHRQLWEYLGGWIAEFRHRFAEGGWSWLGRQALAFFRSPAGWGVTALVVAYLLIRLRMLRPASGPRRLSPEIVELHRLLRRMDRRLAKANLIRRPGETLVRFAARVESDAGDPAAAAWYADYAEIRYGGTDAEGVRRLRERLHALRPPARRRSEPAGATSP